MKKITRITVETRRVLVIGGQPGELVQWCPRCYRKMRMMEPEYAAAMANVRTRLVYQWVEQDRVHFLETVDGKLLICAASLAELRAGIAER